MKSILQFILIIFFISIYFTGNSQNITNQKLQQLKAIYGYDWVADLYDVYESDIVPVSKGDKYGFAQISTMREFLACTLELKSAHPFRNDLAAVKKDDKWGFIDKKGQLIISYQFDEVGYFSNELCAVKKGKETFFINKKGERLFDTNFYWNKFDSNRLPNKGNNDLYGYIDTQNKEAIPPQYKVANRFEQGIACVSTDGTKYGFINSDGKKVIEEQFSSCGEYHYNLIYLAKDENVTVLDTLGKEIVPLGKNYIDFESFSKKYLRIRNNEGLFGIREWSGKVIFEAKYTNLAVLKNFIFADNNIYRFSTQQYEKIDTTFRTYNSYGDNIILVKQIENQLSISFLDDNAKIISQDFLDLSNFENNVAVAVDKKEKFGMIDNQSKTKIPFKYDDIIKNRTLFTSYTLKKDKKFGLVDENLKEICAVKYDTIYSFDNAEIFYVKEKGKYGIINFKGTIIAPVVFDTLYEFYSGIALGKKNNKYGSINTKGTVIMPFEYDSFELSERLNRSSLVKKNGKYGIIASNNVVLVPAVYDEILDYHYGTFKVKKGNKISFVQDGKTISPEFDTLVRMEYLEVGYITRQNGKYGIVDYYYKEKLPAEYDLIKSENNFFVEVTKNGKKGAIDKNLKQVLATEYDSFQYLDDEKVFFVKKGDKYGIISFTGKVLHEVTIDAINSDISYPKRFIALTVNKKVGVFDLLKEKFVVQPIYKEATRDIEKNKFIIIDANEKYGIVDSLNNIVVPFEYDEINSWSGVVFLKKGNLRAFKIFKTNFQSALEFTNCSTTSIGRKNYIEATKGKKTGLFNLDGTLFLDFIYDKIIDEPALTNENICYIELDKKKGFIKNYKEIIIPPVYEKLQLFAEERVLIAKQKNLYGLIDLNNRIIIPLTHSWLSRHKIVDKIIFIASLNGKFGIYDEKGNVLLPLEYDKFIGLSDYYEIPIFEKDGKTVEFQIK